MDKSWYLDINNFAVHTSWLHGIGKVMAVYAVGLFGVAVLAAWWHARHRSDTRAVAACIWAAAATLLAVAINQPVAHAVARPRPYVTLAHVEVLVARANDFTFPSDHATTAGAATAGLWIASRYGGRAIRNLAVAATVLALAVAFFRVYVGAHYPGDVLAGLALGAAVSVIGWLLLARLLTSLTTVVRDRTPLKPLVSTAAVPRPGRPLDSIR